MATGHQLTEWALHVAGLGWHVFPITPNAKKPPMFKNWEQHATTDTDRISRFWQRGPFNIGIATGPSRLVVIDLDTTDPGRGPNGAEALTRLAADRGVTLPDTYTVATPSGGRHLYYRCPPGVRLRNSAGLLAPRIDTRAEGGYVVAPGSTTDTGFYELHDDTDPAELPGWLVQALSERPSTANSGSLSGPNPAPERPVEAHDRYAAVAVAREVDRVRNADKGEHNAVLSNAAYNLGQLVGAGHLTDTAATAELTAAAAHVAAADCSCTPREIARVIRAGLAAGQRRPRRTGRKEAA